MGEAYAVVVARSQSQANDALEAITADLEELPAVSDLEANRDDRVALHDCCPDDIGFDWLGGDETASSAALATAAHVVRARVRVPRILGAPLEPFSCLAQYDPDANSWILRRRARAFTRSGASSRTATSTCPTRGWTS